MDKVAWKDSYRIDIERIDRQHKKLFELANLFFEALESTKCQGLVVPVLLGLLSYTKVHFSEEEAVMKEINYPDFAAHQIEHQWLREQVETAMMHLNNNRTIDINAMAMFLKKWLTEHIQVEDKKIGDFAAQQSAEIFIMCGANI
jgi:hemerythrin